MNVLRKCYVELLRDYFGEQGSVWRACATLGYSEITLVNVLWKSWLEYSGITLGNVLWKSYFGLLRDLFGEHAVEVLR